MWQPAVSMKHSLHLGGTHTCTHILTHKHSAGGGDTLSQVAGVGALCALAVPCVRS